MAKTTEEMKQALRDKPRLIQYTQARHGVTGGFESLADYEWQLEHWLNPKAAHRFSDCILYYCFDTLIENYRLDEIEEANSQLRFTLYNKEEAQYLQIYCEFVFNLINNIIKWDKPDAVYYKHTEWPRVVHGAIMCRRYMAANNLKYEFWREFDEAEGLEYTPDDHQFLERDKYFSNIDVAAYMHKHWPNWQVPK